MKNFIRAIGNELEDYKILLRNVPSLSMVLFVISCICMNLFANKEINIPISWIACDCGILMSWLSFLSMDIITKRFGAKAGIKVSIIAMLSNLFVCGMFAIVAHLSGNWATYYDIGDAANSALNATFNGTWYILLGSSIAFIVSAAVNCLLNAGIGKLFKKNSFIAYATRSYISTLVGQFIDNLTFALIVSHTFFGWSLIQCITCSFIGCIIELICEIIFSPFGYRACKKWEKDNVGNEYIEYCKSKKAGR